MDSVRLERALEQVHPVKIGMLEAKSLLSILSSEMEDMRLGPRVSLGDNNGSFHLFDPQTITWPPSLFVRAEFAGDAEGRSTYFGSEASALTAEEAVQRLSQFVGQAEAVVALAPDVQRLRGGFLTRLGATFGLGPSRQQSEAAAEKLCAVLESSEFDLVRNQATEVIERARQAQSAQSNGVALFEGAHGISPHYVSVARNYVLNGLGLAGAVLDTLDRKYVVPAHDLAQQIKRHPYSVVTLRSEAKRALHQLAVEKADALVRSMPVEKLREVTNDRLRFQGLDSIGVTTVADVLHQPIERLTQVSGIGEQTAARMKAAAQTLYSEATATPVRNIGDVKNVHSFNLVNTLATFDATHSLTDEQAQRRDRLLSYFAAFPEQLSITGGPFLVIKVGEDYFDQFVEDIAWAQATPSTFLPNNVAVDTSNAWADYLERPAHYQTLLATLLEAGSLGSGQDSSLGLAEDTLSAIRSLSLDLSLMKDIHLRGYQSFGAKYCLVQEKTILGDEMGLGKTVQALAVAAHVSSTYSQKNFAEFVEKTIEPSSTDNQDSDAATKLNELDYSHSDAQDDLSKLSVVQAPNVAPIVVVVPASLIVNWKRELEKFTSLTTFVAHGDQKDDAIALWHEKGGVLIVTYDGARTSDLGPSSLVIVDEAHMIKNPQAQRSQAVAHLIARAQRAVLMTGTPLENRVSEFDQLVSYVNPDLITHEEPLRPTEFRKLIAPVYLRRNQDDVLDELPEKLEHVEWVELSSEDQKNYTEAIENSNWMQARRAAMVAPSPLSAKIERIREIIQEATDDSRNVLIFSFFRDVLSRLQQEFEAHSVGVINGDVPPVKRQQMVDELGEKGNVLLAQIGAGGVGLNIQKASVVILAEVQVKPTIEDQAIARAHRLGQMSAVNVYRIVGDETVDERLLEITARKRKIFDAFARESDAAEVPDAIDISEADLAKQIINEERKRLGMSHDENISVAVETEDELGIKEGTD